MRWPHLLRVEGAAADFEVLIAAANAEGLRVGWLDLEGEPGPPAELEAAASRGVLRAVAARGDRTVAVKPLKGAAVLGDLLREHFRGCRLVLVRGTVAAPLLAGSSGGWRLAKTGGEQASLSTAELVRRLRSPRPLDPAAGAAPGA